MCRPRATSQIWVHKSARAAAELLPNRSNALRSWLLVVSHRAPRSRKNRLVVESLPIEDVFVWCTLFLRRYIHRVSSRHWPSPLTHQDAARIAQRLLLTSSPMAKSQKKPGGGAPCRDSDYMGRRRDCDDGGPGSGSARPGPTACGTGPSSHVLTKVTNLCT